MLPSNSSDSTAGSATWPALPFTAWSDTRATIHLWCQIVGKVRLVQGPWINHAWHATFYVTARGITTSPIAYGTRSFDVEFDFINHLLQIRTSDALSRTMTLRPMSVADFYKEFFTHLADLGLFIRIDAKPNEVLDAIPFEQDKVHASYDCDYVNRFWRVLVQADRVLKQFRAGFIGKNSPVHLFWGSLDLATTRFSGREAPVHPGGIPNCPDWVTREAYSHEVSSCGFWPGNDQFPQPVFYAYAYPGPPGYPGALARPDKAVYDTTLGEFLLPYDEVRLASAPDALLLDFLQSTYAAAADLGKWARAALERQGPAPHPY